jgi:hypothetical protein
MSPCDDRDMRRDTFVRRGHAGQDHHRRGVSPSHQTIDYETALTRETPGQRALILVTRPPPSRNGKGSQETEARGALDQLGAAVAPAMHERAQTSGSAPTSDGGVCRDQGVVACVPHCEANTRAQVRRQRLPAPTIYSLGPGIPPKCGGIPYEEW